MLCYVLSGMRPAIRNGLLVANGDFWRKNRKMIEPSFHFKVNDILILHLSKVVQPSNSSPAFGQVSDINE